MLFLKMQHIILLIDWLWQCWAIDLCEGFRAIFHAKTLPRLYSLVCDFLTFHEVKIILWLYSDEVSVFFPFSDLPYKQYTTSNTLVRSVCVFHFLTFHASNIMYYGYTLMRSACVFHFPTFHASAILQLYTGEANVSFSFSDLQGKRCTTTIHWWG